MPAHCDISIDMEYTSATFWLCLLPALAVLLLGDRLLRGREKARNIFHRIMMLAVSVVLISLSGWVTLGIFAGVSMAAYGLCHWGLHYGARGRRVMLVWRNLSDVNVCCSVAEYWLRGCV